MEGTTTTTQAKTRGIVHRIALKVALYYLVLGGLWIFITDRLLPYLGWSPALWIRISTYKGWLFMAVTSTMLYLALRRLIGRFRISEVARGETETRLSRIAETIAEGVVIVDREGRITFANAAAEKLAGITRPGLLARTYNDPGWKITAVDGGPFPDSELPFRRVMATRQPVFGVEHAIEQPDGRRIILSINAAPLVEADGSVSGMVASLFDVTDRKQAEFAILRERDLAKKYLDVAGVIMVALDDQGRVLMINRKGLSTLGYGEDEIVGRNWFDLFIPARQREEVRAVFFQLMAGKIEAVKYVENLILSRSGEERTIAWHNALLFDPAGRIAGTLSSGEDVTERRRAEAALRESEEKFRGLSEQISDGVAVIVEGKFRWVNQSFADIHGWTVEELIGRSPESLVVEEEAPILQLRMDRTLSDQAFPLTQEFKIRRRDGRRVVTEAISKKARFGGKDAIQVVVRDITRRKQAEEALAEEKERLAVTLRSIGDGVITTDLAGRVALINQVAEEWCGWKESEAVGRPLGEVFHIISEQTREPCENAAGKVLERGEVVGLANRTILCSRDGTERVIADSGSPVRDREGRILGVVVVFRDVTEKRKLEEELAKREKLESIGLLAGGIAHDFNNILTAVLGNVSLARLDADQPRAVEARLQEAERACARARDLTQQLLTFSRGGAPVKTTAALGELIREAAGFALHGSQSRARFELPPELWPAEVDPGQISQVIQNLVINADQAMPEGGAVEVTAENRILAPSAPETELLAPGPYLRIAVRDHGIGIAPEHLKKIFDPFFTTKQAGSGLGLATAYSIVHRHQGQLRVESVLGQGSTFYLLLRAAPEAASAPRVLEVERMVTGRGRILVMDDEPAIRDLLSLMLADLGYAAEFVADGTTAISRYEAARTAGQPFDAVILDLTIPGGLGGKETARRILERDPAARIIVSSGYSTDPIMSEFKRWGFVGSLAKPFRIQELSQVLAQVLAKSFDS